jgi:hypothetical protein
MKIADTFVMMDGNGRPKTGQLRTDTTRRLMITPCLEVSAAPVGRLRDGDAHQSSDNLAAFDR